MAHYNRPEATGPVAAAYPPTTASYPPLPAVPPGQVNSSPLPQSYPPPSFQAGYAQGPYVASPPVAYPVKNELPLPQQTTSHSHPPESKRRGDGFWQGCCAALCCCCLLDMCF